MKVTIPESYAEVTVRQYKNLWAAYEKEQDGPTAIRRCIEVMGNLEPGALNDAEYDSLGGAASKLQWLLDEPDPFTMRMPLVQRLHLEGREYGFIPDWTRLTVAEHADLETMCSNDIFRNLERVMAILYRPIVKEAFGMYEIETYEPDKERSKVMLDCTMDVCVSAVVFFCNTARALATTTRRYLREEATAMQSTKNGDGTD